jgi:hypothetical protein
MSRMRNVLVGIAIVGVLVAGAVPSAHAMAQTAQRGPGGGGHAEPDVAFLNPNESGSLRDTNDTAVQDGGQVRDAAPSRPARIDPVTGLSIRQRVQLLREQGVSRALIHLVVMMLVR